MQNQPMVSVCVATYNHERYIGRALDSIHMQKVDFPFEIVVGEDCSTDATRRIVEQYAMNYPGIYKLILHKKNVGMINNQNCLIDACTGKYVAKLEGDDYWTDDRKLKKQVEFLERHQDFIAHAHNVHIVDSCGNIRQDMPDYYWDDKVFTWNDYLSTGALGGHTVSQCYRNIFHDMCTEMQVELYKNTWLNEDEKLNLYLSFLGRKFICKEYMANWMVEIDGNNNWTNRIKKREFAFEKRMIDSYTEQEKLAWKAFTKKIDFSYRKAEIFISMIKSFGNHPSLEKLKTLCDTKVKYKKLMHVVLSKLIKKGLK